MSRARLHPVAALPLLAALLLTAGCSPGPHLARTWRNPAQETAGLDGVLVVGPAALPGQQRTWENVLTTRLQRQGLDAAPGRELIDPRAGPVDRRRLARALRDRGLETVLVARVIGVQDAAARAPGYVLVDGAVTGRNHLFDFLDYRYREVVRSGVLDRAARVALEVNLYRSLGGVLLWSGQLRDVDPSRLGAEADLMARLLLEPLTRGDLLGV